MSANSESGIEVERPVIVGAGPVGLAAALFLARDGVKARVIDAAAGSSPQSKALAVNPRTLEILEPTGVTAQMLTLGKRIRGARVMRRGKRPGETETVGELRLDDLRHKYPFMLALSQAVTARLLESALGEQGVRVEWGTALVGCREGAGGVAADLKPAAGAEQTVRCPWLLAADGAHSTVRRALGIAFEGSNFERPWHLADVPLATALEEDHAHIFLPADGGFLFLIRVVNGDEPADGRLGDPLWRVIGDFPDLLERLEVGRATGPVVWSSEFGISHRINERMQQGQVYFAGDAAHVHSPIGARGMNLGIEDAWVFSRLHRSGGLAGYGAMRRKVDRRVVRRIELVTRMVRGESASARVVRGAVLPLMVRMPVGRGRMMAMLTGLDHEVMDLAVRGEV